MPSILALSNVCYKNELFVNNFFVYLLKNFFCTLIDLLMSPKIFISNMMASKFFFRILKTEQKLKKSKDFVSHTLNSCHFWWWSSSSVRRGLQKFLFIPVVPIPERGRTRGLRPAWLGCLRQPRCARNKSNIFKIRKW